MEFKGVSQDSCQVYIVDDRVHEEDVKYPLSGPRGDFVTSLLGSMSLLDKTRIACWKGQGPEVVEEDILKSDPKVIIGLGTEMMNQFIETSRKITDMSGSVHDISIQGREFKYLVLMSPSYVLNRLEDSSATLRFSQDLYKAFQIVSGEYKDVLKEKRVLFAHTYDEFVQIYKTYFKDDKALAYDIETNARPPLSLDSEIIGFSVANKSTGVYMSLKSLDHEISEEDKKEVEDFLVNEIFEKEDRKLIIHNTMYERPYTLCCLNYEINYDKADDTLVMARLLRGAKEGAGLKYQAQKNLQYPDWETGLSNYISGFRDIVSRILFGPKKFSPIAEEILSKTSIFEVENTDAFKSLAVDDQTEFLSMTDKIRSALDDIYSPGEIIDLGEKISEKLVVVKDRGGIQDSTIPYNWIPDRVLCQYGAVDSLATYDLRDFYFEMMDRDSTDTVDLHKGYRNWLEHMYVAYIMERNGLYWNEELVSKDEEFLINQATNCLRTMLKSPVFTPFIYETCDWKYRPVILSDYLPSLAEMQGFKVEYDKETEKYTVKFNGKRCAKGRISEIKIPPEFQHQYNSFLYELFEEEINSATSYEELRTIYNPSSSTQNDIPRKILINDTLQMGGRILKLHTLATSPEFESTVSQLSFVDQKFLKVAKLLGEPSELKEMYKDQWAAKRRELFEGFCVMYRSLASQVKCPEINNILREYEPVDIETFDDGGIITIYDSLVLTGIDQDDPSTWSPEFEWMINFRLFKKSAKIISSYIRGSVGRQSVVVVDKESVTRGDHRVLRKSEYRPDISGDEDYIMAAKWSPNTAETGRWRSAQHCHPGWTRIKLADGRDLPIKEVVEEFSEGKSLYVYSCEVDSSKRINSAREYRIAKIKEAYLSHYTDEFVRFTLDNGGVVDVTPDHKMIRSDGTVDYAININEGDGLFPAYFKEDDKKYQMILSGESWKYCHYLADEYNERHNLLREIPKDEFTSINGKYHPGWCRHHIDFNFYNNSPENVIRVGRATHFTKWHSGEKEYYKRSWEHRRERGNDPCPDYYGRLLKKASEDPEFEKRWKESKHDSGLESMRKLWQSEEYRKGHTERNKVRGLNKSVQLISTIYDKENDTINLTPEVYEDLRKSQGKSAIGIMKWDSLMKYVSGVDELISKVREYAYHNHKVVKKEVVTLEEPIPVYSLSIEQDSPNYVVSAGICINNTIPWGSQVKKYYTSRFKGGTCLAPDYSQMEVRTLAAISKDKNMLELFHSGKDFHTETAKKIYRKDEVTTAERRFSKTATFSLLYGAMEESFAANYCKGDLDYAKMVYGGFFEAYPGVKKWVDERHQEVQRDHRVSLELSGRFIPILPEGEGRGALNSMLRKSQNYPIQAQSADLTGCVIFDIQEYLEENHMKSLIIMYVHDSIEIDVYPYEMLQLVDKMKFILNDSPMRRMGLPSKADVTLGKSLGHEIDMESIEYNEDFTEGVLSLKGYQDEIYETVENWKEAYKTVEIFDEEWKEEFVSMGELFILRKAYTPTLGTLRHKGTCKVRIKYYS